MGLGKAEKIEDLNDIGKENEENLLKKAEERANLIKKNIIKNFKEIKISEEPKGESKYQFNSQIKAIINNNGKEEEITFNLKQMQNLKDLSSSKMLVNSTPIGMRGKAMDMSPIDEGVLKTLPENATVYDIVYNPLKTELLKMAKKNGYNTITGLDMFVNQGAKAFEIWTGHKAKPEVMKIAVLEAMAE